VAGSGRRAGWGRRGPEAGLLGCLYLQHVHDSRHRGGVLGSWGPCHACHASETLCCPPHCPCFWSVGVSCRSRRRRLHCLSCALTLFPCPGLAIVPASMVRPLPPLWWPPPALWWPPPALWWACAPVQIGDETFIIAAIMAMRHSRSVVLGGALSALALMTVRPHCTSGQRTAVALRGPLASPVGVLLLHRWESSCFHRWESSLFLPTSCFG